MMSATDGQPGGPPASCWNLVGTGGDASCPRLPEFGHCRHCPVYSQSGKKLFEREIPAEYREEWKDNLARAKEQHAADQVSVLVFRLRDEWLALKTIVFHEVSKARPVHSIPSRSNARFRGVVNMNGEMLLCVSLADILGLGGRGPASPRPGNGAPKPGGPVGGEGSKNPTGPAFGAGIGTPAGSRTGSGIGAGSVAGAGPGPGPGPGPGTQAGARTGPEAAVGAEPGAGDAGSRARERMVVVGREESRFVFTVDEIAGVVLIPRSGIRHSPATVAESPGRLVQGVFDHLERNVGLLDEERLMEIMNRSLQN